MSTRFSLKLFLYVLADEFGSSRSCVRAEQKDKFSLGYRHGDRKQKKNIRKILMMLSNVNIPVSHSLSCDITLLLLCTVCRVKWESVSGLTWQCCCLARGFITFFMLLRAHDRARGSREHFRCDFQIFADFLSSPLQLAFFCFQASSTQYHNNHSSSWFVSLRPSLTLCVILLLVLYANGIFVRDFHVSRDPTMTTRNEEHSFYSLKAKTAATAVCFVCPKFTSHSLLQRSEPSFSSTNISKGKTFFDSSENEYIFSHPASVSLLLSLLRKVPWTLIKITICTAMFYDDCWRNVYDNKAKEKEKSFWLWRLCPLGWESDDCVLWAERELSELRGRVSSPETRRENSE